MIDPHADAAPLVVARWMVARVRRRRPDAFPPGLDYEDMVGHVTLGVITGLRGWTPAGGSSRWTWMARAAAGACWAWRRRPGAKPLPGDLPAAGVADRTSAEASARDRAAVRAGIVLDELAADLRPALRAVLAARAAGATAGDLAADLGVTRKRAEQLSAAAVAGARAKLRGGTGR